MKCRSGADNPLKIGGHNQPDTGGTLNKSVMIDLKFKWAASVQDEKTPWLTTITVAG